MPRLTRRLFALASLAALAACASQTPISQQPVDPIGAVAMTKGAALFSDEEC